MNKERKEMMIRRITLNIITLALLVFFALTFHAKLTEKQIYKIDLQGFSGRVVAEKNFSYAGVAEEIRDPNEIKKGEDVLLVFGESGVSFWKPETLTRGAFFSAQALRLKPDILSRSFHLTNQEMLVTVSTGRLYQVLLYGLATLIFTVASIAATIFTVRLFWSPY